MQIAIIELEPGRQTAMRLAAGSIVRQTASIY